MITLALSKGRIFTELLPFLAAAGIVPAEDPEHSRKLMIGTNREDLRIVVLAIIATVGALALDGGWAKKVHAKIQSSAPLFCVAQLALLLLMVLSVMFMVNSTYSPFIYFQY